MGMPVVTVASGGMPVVQAANGLAVTEAVNKSGAPVTKVASGGMPVVFVTEAGAVVPSVSPTMWNAADKNNITLSNNNLTAVTVNSGNPGVRSVAGLSVGKYYWEATMTTWGGSNTAIGLAKSTFAFGGASSAAGQVAVFKNPGIAGAIYVDGTYSGSTLGSLVSGNVIGIAVDLSAGLIWFRVAPAGNWNGSGTANPATGIGGLGLGALIGSVLFPIYFAFSASEAVTANFGASAFTGTLPAGFTSGWLA